MAIQQYSNQPAPQSSLYSFLADIQYSQQQLAESKSKQELTKEATDEMKEKRKEDRTDRKIARCKALGIPYKPTKEEVTKLHSSITEDLIG